MWTWVIAGMAVCAGELREVVLATNGAGWQIELRPAVREMALLPLGASPGDAGDALLGVILEGEVYALPFHQRGARDLEVTEQIDLPSGVLYRARVPGRDTEVQIRLRSSVMPWDQVLGEAPLVLIDIAASRAPRATRALVALPLPAGAERPLAGDDPPGTRARVAGATPHEIALFGGAPCERQPARELLAREGLLGTTFLAAAHVPGTLPTPSGPRRLAYTAHFASATALAALALPRLRDLEERIDVVDDVLLGADVPVAMKQIAAAGLHAFLARTLSVQGETGSRWLVLASDGVAMIDQAAYCLALAPGKLAAWIEERARGIDDATSIAACAELTMLSLAHFTSTGDATFLAARGPALRRSWSHLRDASSPPAAAALLAAARLEAALGGTDAAAAMASLARHHLEQLELKTVVDQLPLLLRAGIDTGLPNDALLALCRSKAELPSLARDLVACYLGCDPTDRWPEPRDALADHLDVIGPRASCAVGTFLFLEALAGMRLDRSEQRLSLRPVHAPLRVPLLAFAKLDAGAVPWFEVIAGTEGPTWSITHRELLIGMHVSVDMSAVGG